MSAGARPLALRRVEAEILDDLAEADPRAVASRRDLRRVNRLMAHRGIMADLLARHLQAPRRILEIGAGDGSFTLALARRLHRRFPDVGITLLDRRELVRPETRDAFRRLRWRPEVVTGDVFAWAEGASGRRFDVVTANLFLHHFADADLTRLLARLAPLAPVFLATEPLRAPFALFASRMLWAIGANDVTRNDAPASVRAGFAGRELAHLWPREPDRHGDWHFEEGRRGLFTHAFAAVRTVASR